MRKMRRGMFNLSLIFILFWSSSYAFYWEGFPRKKYCGVGEDWKKRVETLVNPLVSVYSAFSYNVESFGFCPLDVGNTVTENFGQRLIGKQPQKSLYKFLFRTDRKCVNVCKSRYDQNNNNTMMFLKKGMFMSYENRWVIDNLPVTWCYETFDGGKYCSPGFSIGCYVNNQGVQMDACQISEAFSEQDSYYLFNHADITIYYNHNCNIVKATVSPKSFSGSSCQGPPLNISADFEGPLDVTYTYSVYFREDNSLKWENRWDYLLDQLPHNNILMFSSLNSLIIVAFLGFILIWLSCKRFGKHKSQGDKTKMIAACYAWEVVRGDVFRIPPKPMMLSIFLGVGVQTVCATLMTLTGACIGLLSPANRGALATTATLSFASCGLVGGYISTRFYKTFQGEKPKINSLMTALLFPGFTFIIFDVVNLIYWSQRSSDYVPAMTILELLLVWFCLLVPMLFLGSYLGLRQKMFKHPVPVNVARRIIPNHSCCKKPICTIVMGGILPFSCIFIQLFFILNSIWSHQIYNIYGNLLLTTVLLAITCCVVTILLCYLHLTAEDYRWWWRSFITSGFVVFYFLIYAFRFYFTQLYLNGLLNFVVYLCWLLIVSTFLFLGTGTIGFLSCYWFLCKIYTKFENEVDEHEKGSHGLPILTIQTNSL